MKHTTRFLLFVALMTLLSYGNTPFSNVPSNEFCKANKNKKYKKNSDRNYLDFYFFDPHSIEQEEIVQDTINFFKVVDLMPEFPGGDAARLKYLKDNLNYPQEAREQGIEGSVYVSFIVEPNGNLSNIKIISGIGGGCDEEVIRIIENMPYWIPGIHKGLPVRVLFKMPILFKLNNNKNKIVDYNYSEGLSLMIKKKYPNAIKHFDKSIKKKGEHYKEAYANRAICYYKLGDLEQALNDLDMAISLDAKVVTQKMLNAYSDIALEYLEMENYTESIRIYNKALSINNYDADALYNRGVAYFYSGEQEKACADWQTALDLGQELAAEIIKENCN